MHNPNCWRQPVPTDILEILDERSQVVFIHIYMRMKREKSVETFLHGNKYFQVILEPGQCIFNVRNFCREMGWTRPSVIKNLEIISNLYHELYHEAKPYGLLITIDSPSELLKFYHETNTKRKLNENQTKTKRATYIEETVKSVKSVKNEKITPPPKSPPGENKGEEEKFLEFWNAYPRSIQKDSTLKEWERIDPSLYDQIILSAKKQKRFNHFPDPKYIPSSANWLKNKRWEDKVNSNFKPL